MIRENLPELTKVYNEAMKKEGEKKAQKKPPQKETIPKASKNEISVKTDR